MNITLIGMSGAGKSHLGKLFADKLQYQFIDIDGLMEQQHQKTLHEILYDLGEEEFLLEQQQLVLNLKPTNTIISPGGSVVYTPEAMVHLKNLSKIVFIDVPLETIKDRIETSFRGIIGLGRTNFDGLYNERHPLYERWADVTISGEESLEEIIKKVRI